MGKIFFLQWRKIQEYPSTLTALCLCYFHRSLKTFVIRQYLWCHLYFLCTYYYYYILYGTNICVQTLNSPFSSWRNFIFSIDNNIWLLKWKHIFWVLNVIFFINLLSLVSRHKLHSSQYHTTAEHHWTLETFTRLRLAYNESMLKWYINNILDM